jgi:hypothetical protein
MIVLQTSACITSNSFHLKHRSASLHKRKRQTSSACIKHRSSNLFVAVLNSNIAITEQPPPDPHEDPGSREMLLCCASLLFWSLAWQHVVCPTGRNARPLNTPLEHRQQQGDEPEKHQFCVTPNTNYKSYSYPRKIFF